MTIKSLPESASIRVHGIESEWRFDWDGFDGDDCFQSFRITVTEPGLTQDFDFGPSVVWSLRWLNRFFANETQTQTRGGLSVYRSGQDFRMAFEYNRKQHEFHLRSPQVQLDREFLPLYDGEEENA